MKSHTVITAIALLAMTFMVGVVDAAGEKTKKVSNGEIVTNSIGMKFVMVPAGSFTMGKWCQEPDDPFVDNCVKKVPDREKPPHQVTISQPFLIGQYEVTQEQWYKVMGSNPAKFKTNKVGKDSSNYPVEKVSWNDVQNFINRLNAKEGKRYRLPTEAEWEYACKSGGKDQKFCGGNDSSDVAWYDENSGNSTHRVGTKQPNGLGIYDMSGNVWEWVSDWYDKSYYGKSPEKDPQGPSGGKARVVRGGSWDYDEDSTRSTYRDDNRPDNRIDSSVGFRLVSP